ncbi:B12-binding domain-containing radical SAM protein [Candidatus Altiarchaeota archaeon]
MCVEGLSIDGFRGKLLEFRPSFVGFTSTTVQINNCLILSKIVKETLPDSKTVMGGVHPTVLTEETLSNESVDFIVRGEGENTLLELLSRRKVSEIDGLSYKKDGRITHNKERGFIDDIDTFPHPAYDLLALDKYKPTLGNFKQLPSISMITSRGCPGQCTFCYSGLMGKKIRFMSAERILDEIKFLISEYGIRDLTFYDDTFTANKRNVMDLCDLLISERLGLTWSCMSRLDYVSSDLLEKMSKAGCHQIGYGIETCDPEIMKNIKKNAPLERAKELIEMTQRSGIDARAMFMLGNPGETAETMEKTIDFALSLDADLYLFNVTTPFPGTEMFSWAEREGYLKTKNWEDYNLYTFVMDLPTVDNETIQKYYKKAYSRCYMRPSYILKRLKKIDSLDTLKAHIEMVPYLAKNKISSIFSS